MISTINELGINVLKIKIKETNQRVVLNILHKTRNSKELIIDRNLLYEFSYGERNLTEESIEDVHIISELKRLNKLTLKDARFSVIFPSGYIINELNILHSFLRNDTILNIATITSLKKLRLITVDIISIPDEIVNLKNLTEISLRGSPNHSDELENFEILYKMTNLTILKLQDWNLGTITKSIGNLKNLKELHLRICKIRKIEDVFENMTKLEVLNLNWNELRTLPPSIKYLKKLTTLKASFNRLIRLPESITELKNLINLDLEINLLLTIPLGIYDMKHLKRLNLHMNTKLVVHVNLIKDHMIVNYLNTKRLNVLYDIDRIAREYTIRERAYDSNDAPPLSTVRTLDM